MGADERKESSFTASSIARWRCPRYFVQSPRKNSSRGDNESAKPPVGFGITLGEALVLPQVDEQDRNIAMSILINGNAIEVPQDIPGDLPLLWFLRDYLGLTGTKYGCGHGVCGACIVVIDGAQAHACQTMMAEVSGKAVVTIEGQHGAVADALFTAWKSMDVAQCGFCQPGQINSASVLLSTCPEPEETDIDIAMRHNLCRCATYQRIRAAIHAASGSLSEDRSTSGEGERHE